MDARERLKRYLEQRRELGERDLMLDGMSVDEALALMGGLGAPLKRAERKRGEVYAEELERRAEADARRAAAEAEAAERGSTTPAPGPDASGPREGSADYGGDWRAALRAAGGAPPAAGARGAGTAPAEDEMPRRKPPEAVTETDPPAERARAARAPRPAGG